MSLQPKSPPTLESAMAEIRLKQPWTQTDLLRDMLARRELQNGPTIFEIASTTDLAAQTVRTLDERTRPNARHHKYKSAFISYGGLDAAFARRLYDDLMRAGVHVFYFPETSIPGRNLHRMMNEAIYEYDVVIIICSRSAASRAGWLNELEQTLTREAAEGGAELLIPILLDDFVLTEWEPDRPDLARRIRSRVAADFRGAIDHPGYGKELSKLLLALGPVRINIGADT